MATQVTPTPKIHHDGQARQPAQVPIDIAGGGQSLALPDSTIRNHAFVVRGLGYVPESKLSTGLFGRMFRELEAYIPDAERIRAIAERMAEPAHQDPAMGDGQIPAGYTYLGQFVDHDITFDPTPLLERSDDPDALTNFRTPRFDLDSLYGRGPADQPYLYHRPQPGAPPQMLIGRVKDTENEFDLPRNEHGVALIGDPRNDENIFVCELQMTMLMFHNRVTEWLQDNPRHIRGHETVFDAAQRLVRWHYQWIVVHDFLRRVVEEATFRDVLRQEPLIPGGRPVEQVVLRFFSWDRQIFMPVEFAAAAYRFGHSMVRPRYRLNTVVPELPIFTPQSAHENPLSHFGGFRPLPAQWQIEWGRFFEVDGTGPELQRVRRIDRLLAPPLLEMPPEQAEGIRNLAMRNLTRGARLGLPSGQDVAEFMGLAPLGDQELDLPGGGPAPLWYYVLREAETRQGGMQLGIVGSRIVMEVFCGMLLADPQSYLRRAPGWRPVLPGATSGDFTMPDLIKFTGFGVDRPGER
ncbi:heme peroxidase family protein [Streptomyces capparidis]